MSRRKSDGRFFNPFAFVPGRTEQSRQALPHIVGTSSG